MAFRDILFPPEISFGAVGGAGFKTTIVTLDSLSDIDFNLYAWRS